MSVKALPIDLEAEGPSPLERLRGLSVTNRLAEMKEALANENYIFPDMVLSGSTSLFFGWPNCGKTLLAFHFIVTGIEAGRIDPAKVFYLNADDNYEGLYHKGRIAEEFGFAMISPAENGMTPDALLTLILDMANSEAVAGHIFILDTLKKFADMMSKRSQATLYEALRRLNAAGATVILLGHANKHPNAEGDMIYEGTADTLNDVDIAYMVCALTGKGEREQHVEFRNIKDRGRVCARAAYSYIKDRDQSYMQMLRSVRRMDDAEAEGARQQAHAEATRERHESVLAFLKAALVAPMNESQILAAHKSGEFETAAEFSATELRRGLRALVGVELNMRRDKDAKNAKVYTLKRSAAADYRSARDGD